MGIGNHGGWIGKREDNESFFALYSNHIQSTILNITLRNKAKFKSIHFRVAWNFLKKPFILPGFIWILQNHVYCCFTMYWIFVEKKVQTLWLWKLFSFLYFCCKLLSGFFVLSSHFPLLSHFVRLTFQRSFTQLTPPLNVVPSNIFEEQPHLQSRSKWSCSAFAKHIKSFDSN